MLADKELMPPSPRLREGSRVGRVRGSVCPRESTLEREAVRPGVGGGAPRHFLRRVSVRLRHIGVAALVAAATLGAARLSAQPGSSAAVSLQADVLKDWTNMKDTMTKIAD